MLNMTPVDWYSKLQTTLETATFGSEHVAARNSMEQIIDLCITLQCLRVLIDGSSFMFGDNESVVKCWRTIVHSASSTQKDQTLTKKATKKQCVDAV